MTQLLPKLHLDISSFWAGVILILLLVAIFFRYRKRLSAFLSRTITSIINFRESLSVTSDSDYIQVLYKYIQGLHICSDYFPLNRILVPAACITPPPYLYPGKESLETSLIQQVIGYDPLLPQLNAAYHGPTFPLLDAVQTGTNLCLVGFPGTGKTSAIAECIAGLIEPAPQGDPSAAEDSPEPRIPFYVTAHHLLAQFPGRDMLGILLKALELNKSFQVIPNFAKYLTNAIGSKRSILFIDDMDGLPLDDINRLANFITTLRTQLPDLQVVATASPSCLGSLVVAPVEFISIAPWGNQEKNAFLEKLSKLWPELQLAENQAASDSYSISNAMLVVSSPTLTPLEFTLKSIAAYGGDLAGPSPVHAIDAYLKRTLGLNGGTIHTMELIAVYCLDANRSSFTRRELSAWLEDVYKKNNQHSLVVTSASFQSVIQSAIDHNILLADPDNSYHFQHPTIAGLLAARGMSKSPQQIILGILESPDWGHLHESMRYFSAFNDIKPYLKPFLSDTSLLKNRLLRASLWIDFVPQNTPEETALLKQVTREIHASSLYMIKIRLTCALVRAQNPQVKAIFQHLLKSTDQDTRRAAAVGLGALQELTGVPNLINQLNDRHPSSTAACYALGRIGSPRSLEAVAEALLHGSELLRRAAAESLAQNRSEGHPALREGATRDDLLVRYAVVHGLSLINEPWSLEILDKMRIDEKEWVVRDLAQQTYQIMASGSPYLPQDTPPPHAAPWLIEFALEQDLPPLTAENALDSLLKALETGTDEQRQNALAHLARTGLDELIPRLLEIANDGSLEIAQQAMLAIWMCASRRYKVFS